MQLKLRRIGGSRGVILPDFVATRLSGKTIEGFVLGQSPDEEEFIFDTSVTYLELTNIGRTVILTDDTPDELELRAALAYATVKFRRRRLLERLAGLEPSGAGHQAYPPGREQAERANVANRRGQTTRRKLTKRHS